MHSLFQLFWVSAILWSLGLLSASWKLQYSGLAPAATFFHLLLWFAPYGELLMTSQANSSASPLSSLFPSDRRNHIFVFQGSRSILASKVTSGHPCLGTKHLPSTLSATEGKKTPFFLWIKTCKIVLNHILSDAFLYVIFFVNIFLVSSTACKGFISLKKGEED